MYQIRPLELERKNILNQIFSGNQCEEEKKFDPKKSEVWNSDYQIEVILKGVWIKSSTNTSTYCVHISNRWDVNKVEKSSKNYIHVN